MPVNPNRDTCPPGLLATADLLQAHRERAADILAVARQKREVERLRIRELRARYAWHPWSMAKLLIVSGASAFFIAWGAGLMADFLKLYDQTVSKASAIPQAALGGFSIPSLNTIIPLGLSGFFAQLPRIGAKESFFIALAIVLAIALIKLAIVLVNWKKIHLLHDAEKRVNLELETLKAWMGSAKK